MATPLLQVKNLRAGYGRAEVLHGIDLQAGKGSVITVIGPNGAGKSTLLNTLMGILPGSGGIEFNGEAIGKLTLEDRVMLGIALVPEKRELFGSMPVEDNLVLGGFRQMRLGNAQWRDRLADVYELFPRLKQRRTQLAGTLSGGERQMLAVGRSLMSQPSLLMLDEPSLGLAPLVVREIFNIITELRKTGVTIVLVEQNARAALAVADYGYVLEMGELSLHGPAADLAEDPRVIDTYLGAARKSDAPPAPPDSLTTPKKRETSMKITSLIALAGLAAAGAVQAQSVTIYGMVDAGVESVSNVATAGGRINRMPSNTGILPSRVGFRGKEDLGGGLSAVYTLEMGFAPDTGASGQGGRLFGRQSTVGLSGDWGTVTLGRQWTMLFNSLLDADIVGPSVYGLGSLDSYIPNSRIDNSIAYKGKFDNLTLGATYSLGRDTVNAGPSPAGANCAGESGADAQACREWSALVKYDTPNWGAAMAYDTMNGRTVGAAPDAVFGNLNSSAKTDSRLSLNGYVKFADLKVAGGVIRRNNDASATKPKSDLWYVGASYPLTPVLTLDGTLAKLSYKNVDNADSTLLALRALYSLSKRTTLYAQTGWIRNQSQANVSVSGGAAGSNPALGESQNGVMLGINHKF